MIRPATPDDLDTLIDLAKAMHAESRFAARYPFDAAKVRGMLLMAMSVPGWCAFVADKDGETVGAMIGYVVEQFFSRAKVAQDIALFVHPSARGGMMAAKLVRRFASWASENGAVDVEIGVTTGVNIERTDLLLGACGFSRVGRLYSKGVI